MFPCRSVTSAAEAGAEDKPIIARVNCCATQNKRKPDFFRSLLGYESSMRKSDIA